MTKTRPRLSTKNIKSNVNEASIPHLERWPCCLWHLRIRLVRRNSLRCPISCHPTPTWHLVCCPNQRISRFSAELHHWFVAPAMYHCWMDCQPYVCVPMQLLWQQILQSKTDIFQLNTEIHTFFNESNCFTIMDFLVYKGSATGATALTIYKRRHKMENYEKNHANWVERKKLGETNGFQRWHCERLQLLHRCWRHP